jgi:hypothetical protein
MESEAYEMVKTMERLLQEDDGETAWYLQNDFARIWNNQLPNSPERVAMAEVWKKSMIKWH